MKANRKKRWWHNISKVGAWTNVALGGLLLCVGVLSFAPVDDSLQTDGDGVELYRCGNANSGGVSLMFNVYWGTEEVYQILDVLKTHEAKATFFIGGSWADDNVQCLRDIANNGHEIGNHGYFHKDQDKLSLSDNKSEIERCNRFISLAIGIQPTLFAPPSGAYNSATLSACQSLGMKTILWSRDTIDWRDKDAKLIYTRATKNIKSGEFVLMHPMQATVDALDDILKFYKAQSLSVITVSENLREKG